MYLAITLSRLDDFDNACSAYEKVIQSGWLHVTPWCGGNCRRLWRWKQTTFSRSTSPSLCTTTRCTDTDNAQVSYLCCAPVFCICAVAGRLRHRALHRSTSALPSTLPNSRGLLLCQVQSCCMWCKSCVLYIPIPCRIFGELDQETRDADPEVR